MCILLVISVTQTWDVTLKEKCKHYLSRDKACFIHWDIPSINILLIRISPHYMFVEWLNDQKGFPLQLGCGQWPMNISSSCHFWSEKSRMGWVLHSPSHSDVGQEAENFEMAELQMQASRTPASSLQRNYHGELMTHIQTRMSEK